MINELWSFNIVISTVVATWFLAQLIKFIILWIRKRKIEFKIFISSGGMPSAHTAVVTSLALSLGILHNFRSPIFALSLVFAIIVIYDAVGVRQAAGDHARVLNKLVPRILKEEETKHFRTRLGHKPSEVFAGILLGLIVPIIALWNELAIPSTIKNLFTANYLFNLSPGSNFKYLTSLSIIFGLIIFTGLILAIFSWRNKNLVYKKLFSKIYTMLLTIGGIGILLLIFRYEDAYLLSARFLLFILFLAFIAWSLFIIYYGIKRLQKDLKIYNDYLRKEKYIPKNKSH
jgi:acid phosphatase family membrane protein YuiD